MQLRFRLLPLLLLLFTLTLSAQEFPYELDWKREVSLFTTGAAISGTAHLVESQMEGLSLDQLRGDRTGNLPFLDRPATRQQSEAHRVFSDDMLRYSMLLPATTMLNRAARSKALVVGTMFAETVLLNEGITKMTKVIFRRNRPLTYNPEFDLDAQQSENARQSFVSGHTSNTAAVSFFTAKLFHDMYPDSKWRPLVWAGAAAVPLATGIARYKAGKHFPTDIMAGYALGATIGILIPEWHKRKDGKGLRVAPAGNGLSLTYQW